ncbi:MAG: DUF2905 domain-containing protein [Synergistaceae bacterium]|jgi:hypothetical protein|nr:DUF2905 domain-containing protein [Synergistaceae bacterium]
MSGIAKFLMISGAIMLIAGLALFAASKLGLPAPPFGRAPGDIVYSGNRKC